MISKEFIGIYDPKELVNQDAMEVYKIAYGLDDNQNIKVPDECNINFYIENANIYTR